MKKHLKVLSLLLAVLFCASALVACNGDGGESSSTASTSSGVNNEKFSYGPADYGEFPFKDKNYEDSDPIRILCVETDRHKYGEQQFSYLEEQEGNNINSAIQNRNNFLEETYGITFDVTPVKYPTEEIVLLIQGGNDEYDVICDSVDRLVTGISERYYRALDDYMDISYPWWDQQAYESLALGSKHYLITGDAILTDDDNTYLTLYNKDMYSKNSSVAANGDIYDIVRDG